MVLFVLFKRSKVKQLSVSTILKQIKKCQQKTPEAGAAGVLESKFGGGSTV
jgi:hypothetical protein